MLAIRRGPRPFGFRIGENGAGDTARIRDEGEQEAIREMIRMRSIERLPLRTVVAAMNAKGYRVSNGRVARIVKAALQRRLGGLTKRGGRQRV